MDIIENYEIIKHQKNVLINYSLNDYQNFKNFVKVNLHAKENVEKNFDLEVLFNHQVVAKFMNFPYQEIDELKNKRVLLSGIDNQTKEIEHATLVESINFAKKNKLINA